MWTDFSLCLIAPRWWPRPTLKADSCVTAALGGSSPVLAILGTSLCALPFYLADVDECADLAIQCLGGACRNTLGSYECHCQAGFELINGTVCQGTNLIPAALGV